MSSQRISPHKTPQVASTDRLGTSAPGVMKAVSAANSAATEAPDTTTPHTPPGKINGWKLLR